MLDEHVQPNSEAQAVRYITEDLEPTDETAAEIAGGDTGQVTMSSNVSHTYNETLKSSVANLK